MDQASRDLGTRLEWVAVDHWNTEHPHIHILVRGRADDGKDLVISRDYIASGLRARAGDLVTRELGPRSELQIREGLEAEVTAERWTRLDRVLSRQAGLADGVIDLRPERDGARDPLRDIRIGRMRMLERLGVAEPAGPARWVLAEDAEPRLRVLGERGDIIKRLHKAIAKDGLARSPSSFALEGEHHGEPIIGRLVARGHDDELRGDAFAIVDGIDGRVHHLKLPDIDAAGDGPIGGVVELRRFEDARGRTRIALAVRSELVLEKQVTAEGATWLDRQLVAREPAEFSRAGFGAEVRAALEQRIDVLAEYGLAQRHGDKVRLGRNLIETLRSREVDSAGRRLAEETGLTHLPARSGEQVSGTYRQRLSLASGRFAMIDNGLGLSARAMGFFTRAGTGQTGERDRRSRQCRLVRGPQTGPVTLTGSLFAGLRCSTAAALAHVQAERAILLSREEVCCSRAHANHVPAGLGGGTFAGSTILRVGSEQLSPPGDLDAGASFG
ncbi:type IV secretory pathway VirD2 relaxase [Bradyrhizobium sp. LM3.4]